MKLITSFILFTCITCFTFLMCSSHSPEALAEQQFTDEEVSMLRSLLNKEAERVAAQKTFTEEETSLIRILVNEEAEKAVATQPFSEDETSTIRGFLSRLKNIEAGGFIESYYQLESVDPDEGAGNAIFTKIYEREENSVTLDKVELWVAKESTEESPAGFFFSAWFGEIAQRLSPDPVSPDTIGRADNDDFTVYQAYASWKIPIGRGLDFKFGRYVTWLGYEVEESHYNANWSRSLLFTFAEPGVHNGLILSYPVLDNLTISAYVNNGFGPVAGMFVDNNEAKTIGYQFAFDFEAPILGASTLVINGIHGAELESNNHDKRHTWDIWYEFTIADRITSGTDFGFGTEQGTHHRNSHNAKWWGISQVFKTDLTDWLELGVRGEYFWDKDGARTAGLLTTSGGITMAEFTTTFTFKPAGDNYFIRLEPRWDKVTSANGTLSSKQFDDDDTKESSNLSIALAITYEF
ncbi:MAG: outer membrane beta-barrel protein [Candidatus Scalindua sp.]